MSALADLKRLGLKARIVGGRLQVGPPDQLTAEARAMVARLAADLRAELERAAEPLYRAWRCRFADGRCMTVLNPAGMDHAEALAAVDRWPGCTVEPVPASRC